MLRPSVGIRIVAFVLAYYEGVTMQREKQLKVIAILNVCFLTGKLKAHLRLEPCSWYGFIQLRQVTIQRVKERLDHFSREILDFLPVLDVLYSSVFVCGNDRINVSHSLHERLHDICHQGILADNADISDAVLDAILAQDPNAHVACECAAKTGFLMIFGEASGNFDVDYEAIARKVICDIGYDSKDKCFDGNTCSVFTTIDKQSPDIAMGVDNALETKKDLKALEANMSDEEIGAIGAGDQGMMFGYATNETPEYMPYPIDLAHKLCRKLTEVRKDGTLPYLRPDGKSQVSVEYDENGRPIRLEAVVLSTQHDPSVGQEQIHQDIRKYVFDEVLPQEMIDADTKFFINPTGRFVIGGPHGDSGLTGRKIIVDTYGGAARHGGGAFSGKDCTKVDRSGAYAARYVAKNLVAAGLADQVEIQLSYAIGVAQPTSVMVQTFGTGKLGDEKLTEIVREHFDLRPAGIIKMLDLRRPIYKETAAYGHFGRTDVEFPWEKLDKVDELKAHLK